MTWITDRLPTKSDTYLVTYVYEWANDRQKEGRASRMITTAMFLPSTGEWDPKEPGQRWTSDWDGRVVAWQELPPYYAGTAFNSVFQSHCGAVGQIMKPIKRVAPATDPDSAEDLI